MLARQRRILFIPFLLPALILHTTFWLVPKLQALPIALTEWSGITEDRTWVGLANFEELLADPLFFNAVSNTVKFMLIGGVIAFPLALYFAWAMTQPIQGRRFFKFVIFAPSVFSVVIVGMLWLFIFNPIFGLLNELLRVAGLGFLARGWLGEVATALPALAIAGTWQGLGGMMILFLAGLQKIPRELQDAARVDGANVWQVFVTVTWPLLWEVTRILLLLHVIGGLQSFGLVWVTTKGGPAGSTEVVGTYLFRVAFEEWRLGYATAIGIAMLVMIMAVTLFFNRVLRRESIEY